jgi:hypothetical protein
VVELNEGTQILLRNVVVGVATLVSIALPSWALSQGTKKESIYLVCEQPSGSSTYLPGGRVPVERMGTVPDTFSGLLNLTLTDGPATKLVDATWVREGSAISSSDPSEGGSVRMGYADDEIKRFDIDWQKGSSATILLKGLGSGVAVVAYTDIKAGFGLDKVSSFIVVCSEFTTKAAADAETQNALVRVNEQNAALEAAAREAAAAVDQAASSTNASPRPKSKRNPR